MKKLTHFLQLWDGIWSVPLAVAGFIAFGLAGQLLWGLGFGGYDPAVLQPALLAAALLIFFNATVWLGIYMNFRGLYRFYRYDSNHLFISLDPCQKLYCLAAVYAAYLCTLVALLRMLV